MIAESRLRTKELSGDTYCFLLNKNGDVIGVNDDVSPGDYSSCIFSSEEPGYFILGGFSSGGSCQVWYTEDHNLEFLSLYGSETRHSESAAIFGDKLVTKYTNILPSPWDATALYRRHFSHTIDGSSIEDGVDMVDLVWIHSHGDIGGVSDRSGTWVDITSSDCASGSGNKIDNKSGDLEYIAILSCKTVRIEHTSSFDWLRTRGWKTYNDNGTIRKGFFDGVHIVLGYHSTHKNYDHWIYGKSWKYEAKTFANKLKAGKSLWKAWWETNEDTYQEFSNWFKKRSPGMASAIAIVSQKDEKLSDLKSEDIVYGDSRYLMNMRWYGRDSDVPQP